MGVSTAEMISAAKNLRNCARCAFKNSERCAHCAPQRVVNGIVDTILYAKGKKNRDDIFYNCTYREISETVRQRIHPCYICDFKHTDECLFCTRYQIRERMIETIRVGHQKAIQEGKPIPTRRVIVDKKMIKELYY